MNAQRDQRTRPATSAVNQVTSPVIAPTQPPRELDVEAEDSHLVVVVVDPRSATSAQRSATLPVTAQRLEATVADKVVDMVVNRVVTVVDSVDVVVVDKVDKPATLAVVTVTCLVTAPKVKSATTVAKLDISPATAHPKPPLSELATSASNLVTFRLNAPTKS